MILYIQNDTTETILQSLEFKIFTPVNGQKIDRQSTAIMRACISGNSFV